MNKLEKLEWLERELAELKKEIEKEEIEVREFPQNGDEFYYMDSYGNIMSHKFLDCFSSLYGMFEIGNCFKTEEEAEFVVEKLKVIQELKKFSKEFNPREANPRESKWGFYYNPIGEKIQINWTYMQGAELYFESKEIAKKAIEAVGEDRIKKYYLCVED